MRSRYYLRLPDPKLARGVEPTLSFRSVSADGFAEELQNALRTDDLFMRWRALQPDPDEIDPELAAVDPAATVEGEQSYLSIVLIAVTDLPGQVLRQRLRWLADSHWEMRDVTSA